MRILCLLPATKGTNYTPEAEERRMNVMRSDRRGLSARNA